MAEHKLRQWNRAGSRWRLLARFHDCPGRVSGTGKRPRADVSRSGSFAASARRGTVGGAEIAGTRRTLRVDRTHLRARSEICGRTARGGFRGVERGGGQSGAGFVWIGGENTRSDTPRAGRGNVLVRRDGVAGTNRDAHQRFVLGYVGSRR